MKGKRVKRKSARAVVYELRVPSVRGKIWRSPGGKGPAYLAEVTGTDIMTQGTSWANARYMLRDAIESLMNRPDVLIRVLSLGAPHVEILTDQPRVLRAFLKTRRK